MSPVRWSNSPTYNNSIVYSEFKSSNIPDATFVKKKKVIIYTHAHTPLAVELIPLLDLNLITSKQTKEIRIRKSTKIVASHTQTIVTS